MGIVVSHLIYASSIPAKAIRVGTTYWLSLFAH